jgi:lipopolysaccharide export system protein LptA
MRRYLFAIAILFPAAAAIPVLAAAVAPGLDAAQPIAVNADSFLADLNAETGVYSGNVIVTQGAIRLRADRLKVLAPGGRASRMEADGHVVLDSPNGQAMGDTGVYEVAEQLVRLTGNVVLTKDANVLRGSALEVSMATGVAKLTAGPESSDPGAPPARVQGLFVPQQGTGQGAPAGSQVP